MARILRGKIADAVLAEIRRMIMNGELNEGDKLPNQTEFAAQLGVSRPSLREALQTLSRLGAIEQRPGLGTVLKSRAAALMSESLEMSILSDEEGTIQLTEVRRIIETGMVELAVERVTDREMADITKVMQDMEAAAAADDVAAYRDQDLMFHNIIAEACHNQFVQNLFQNIRSSFEQFLKESFEAMPFMLENSLQGHREIFKGLVERNSDLAMAAMRKHLLLVQRAVQDYFQNSNIKRTAK